MSGLLQKHRISRSFFTARLGQKFSSFGQLIPQNDHSLSRVSVTIESFYDKI